MTLEWTKSDTNAVFVHVWRSHQVLEHTQHRSYKGRTSLFASELKTGNISLKLSDIKPSDQGTYKCFIPVLKKASFVELVVGSVSSPGISLAGLDRSSRSVVLQCESAGWYPEPELLWLDGEGKLLSAGPPETVRGPDDLYTVSSRVTVEKRHSSNFTCRVQQNNINQTRETRIHVADDFFVPPLSCAAPIVAGLTACLATSWSPYKWFKDEQQRRREVEMKVAALTKEVKDLLANVSQLKEEKQRCEKDLQKLQEELNNMKKQPDGVVADVQKPEETKKQRDNNQQPPKQEMQ
nr:PREDICTED: butyrophilin subfamily 2 member A2-like [Stegastes partitus]